jgi:hypothetical protein
MLRILFILCWMVLSLEASDVCAQEGLSPAQVKRIKICKENLRGVDDESLEETMDRIAQTDYPEENLKILEAVAKTYAEIVVENKVQGDANKRWLRGMIQLNMAYLQFGGNIPKGGQTQALNQLICRKLRHHLPEELFKHKGLFHSLD